MRYKVSVTFQGAATLELEAASAEAARLAAAELTVEDLARQGHTDVHQLKVAAREITAASALSGSGEDEPAPEGGGRKPRPSGWYRPG